MDVLDVNSSPRLLRCIKIELLSLVLVSLWLVGAGQVCEDLSTAACSLFLASKPDLCQDQALSANCKRFCGQCPLVCYDCPTAVSDPGSCTTKTCALGELCMKRTHTNPGGAKEFIMSCESKSICEGLGLGFNSIIGKRGVAADDVRRDLNFQCCDTDRCNYPTEFMTTTTAQPTTTLTTTAMFTTTLKPLHNCSRDIVFVLDGSTSIGSTNHYYMRQFVQSVINGIAIGPMDSQVALVEYSDTARVEWYLNDHTSMRDLLAAATKIPYVQGSTGTHAAFYLVHSSVLTTRHGDRPNAEDVVIILTDGGTDIPDLAISEAKKLHADGVTIIAIGIGPNADPHELVQYINKGHSYTVSNYNVLRYTAGTVLQNLCE